MDNCTTIASNIETTKNISVYGLRKSGFKVRVIHSRFNQNGVLRKRVELSGNDILPKGGLTEVEITNPDGKTAKSHAACSIKDSFNRRLGLKIAVARALHQL